MLSRKSHGTALLYFARSAGAESHAKVFTHRNREANSGIAARLLRRGKALMESTGLPVFHFSELEQRGADFGEKFSNAFADVYALGYERIIAIGSDCPGLRPADLTTAIHRLESGETVLGPTLNGGVYLLGLHRCDFECGKFAGLEWQQRGLFQDLLNYFSERPIRFLARRADVNGARQLKKALGLLSRTLFARTLMVLLSGRRGLLRACREYLLPADFNGLRPVCRPPPGATCR